MKLKSPIPSNSVKLIDLYNKIISNSLITGPDYQRKLVWKKQHKFAFIETILLNFPFPEIYIASAEVDVSELKTKEVVVDGKQRLTTIVEYIQNKNDFVDQTAVKPFDNLTTDEKREFLNYLITVKDLKDIGADKIIEVFKRINSTNYSLNSNEILNAEFGGGEFAIFCKLLSNKSYKPSEKETGIEIKDTQRNLISDFFEKNKVFSQNDSKRMFDSQYIMLLTSTILEGDYFGRSVKINDYLEKYNQDFTSYNVILGKLINSINIISEMDFSRQSYWFNKANLFTLIIELSKIDKSSINIEVLQLKLSELETKVDIYFNATEETDIEAISPDEKKYFEVSRQGSHEKASREHRGKVISEIIKQAQQPFTNPEGKETSNKEILKVKQIKYCKIIPTKTGLTKSIMDATKSVREFLKSEDIHDYESQDKGPENKEKKEAFFVNSDDCEKTEVSLYKANGRGDSRIWFKNLNNYADPNDVLALYMEESKLKIVNITKFDLSDILSE
jgi:hypothetical protein